MRRILVNSIKLNSNQSRRLTTTVRCHNKSEESEDYTHFGFETVKSKDKAEKGEMLISLNCFVILHFYSPQSI